MKSRCPLTAGPYILLVELSGMLIKQGKTKLKKEERERIVRVVKAVF